HRVPGVPDGRDVERPSTADRAKTLAGARRLAPGAPRASLISLSGPQAPPAITAAAVQGFTGASRAPAWHPAPACATVGEGGRHAPNAAQPCIDPGKVRAVECLPAFRLSPGVTGPASSLPLERVDDTRARQRPGKLLLALPRGGAVDHWAGDVARGVAGRSVADRRLLDLWREPDPALLRQHHLSLAGAPAARGGYSQAPRSCGDFRTDRGHLYAGVPGDAAGRVGMERLGSRMGSVGSRVGAQALLPTSAALVVDRALRGHGVDGGRRRRTAGAEPARQRNDMARDRRGALHPRRSDLRGEMAEPRATGLRLPRGIPHLRAGRQRHALRVHDALRSARRVGSIGPSGFRPLSVMTRSRPRTRTACSKARSR